MSRGAVFLGGALAVVVIGVAAMSFTTGHGSAPVQSVGGPVASVAGGSAGASTSSRSKFGSVASRVMRANSIRAVPDRSLPPGMNAIPPGGRPAESAGPSDQGSGAPGASGGAAGAQGEANGAPKQRFGLSPEGIKGAVQASTPEIKECYEEWLKADPKLQGGISVGFRIRPDPEDKEAGKVDQVEVLRNNLHQMALEGCILNVFQGLSFERPKEGELKVHYPLNFSSGEKKD